jgi:hypothetical protein
MYLVLLLLLSYSWLNIGWDIQRNLASLQPIIDHGNSTLFSNHTVFAALVKSWNGKEIQVSDTCPQVGSTLNVLEKAREHLQNAVEVPIVEWNAIQSKPCPHYTQTHGIGSNCLSSLHHRIERGHGLSHLQVWLEFLFFDNDVDEARFRRTPEYVASTSYSSVSGSFQAFPNGTLWKNGQLYLSQDLLLVFEEGIEPARNFSQQVFILELQQMRQKQDHMLIFTKCSGSHNHLHSVNVHSINSHSHNSNSNTHSHPATTHPTSTSTVNQFCPMAYAITREAARLLNQYYDICGKRWELQVAAMHHTGILQVRVSNYSYFELNKNETTCLLNANTHNSHTQ